MAWGLLCRTGDANRMDDIKHKLLLIIWKRCQTLRQSLKNSFFFFSFCNRLSWNSFYLCHHKRSGDTFDRPGMQRRIDWIMYMRLEPSKWAAAGEQVWIRFRCETMGKNCELITCIVLVSHVAMFSFFFLPFSLRVQFISRFWRYALGIGMGWMLR